MERVQTSRESDYGIQGPLPAEIEMPPAPHIPWAEAGGTVSSFCLISRRLERREQGELRETDRTL